MAVTETVAAAKPMVSPWQQPTRERASASEPNEHILMVDDPSITQQHNGIGSQSLCDLDDPIMQFITQNFNEINAMYLAFSSKSYLERGAQDPNKNHPPVELERAGYKDVPTQNKKVDAEKRTSGERPLKKNNGDIILEGQTE
ncbi:hypothetical protein Tco_1314378 [Tanacetum coccineum]